ncbi:unnamed protein product [Closterium sp. Naga37s-1]|nr:unnamed protein product [Closterium sp. Naga37s-1]
MAPCSLCPLFLPAFPSLQGGDILNIGFGMGLIDTATVAATAVTNRRAALSTSSNRSQPLCLLLPPSLSLQGGDILNIDFGMGIIDTAIAARIGQSEGGIRSHTIVEAHPDVIARMKGEGWHEKEGVRVVEGRWQDVLPQLGQYDAQRISAHAAKQLRAVATQHHQLVRLTSLQDPSAGAWLTAVPSAPRTQLEPADWLIAAEIRLCLPVPHLCLLVSAPPCSCREAKRVFRKSGVSVEYYDDLREFHSHLPHLLKPSGLYSFFNGMCGDNAFFHTVYCHIVALELQQHVGLTTQFIPLPVIRCLDVDTWAGVRHRYWQLDAYHLPVCYRDETEEGEVGEKGEDGYWQLDAYHLPVCYRDETEEGEEGEKGEEG